VVEVALRDQAAKRRGAGLLLLILLSAVGDGMRSEAIGDCQASHNLGAKRIRGFDLMQSLVYLDTDAQVAISDLFRKEAHAIHTTRGLAVEVVPQDQRFAPEKDAKD